MTDEPDVQDDKYDEADLVQVGRALGYDERREPSRERVEAVRSAAAKLRGLNADEPVDRPGPARRTVLVGAAAAGLGILGGALGRDLIGETQPTPTPEVPTEALALTGVPPGVSAQARLINHTWGTEVLLDVRDLPGGQIYRVELETVRDLVGAGSFRSVANVLMKCRFNAAPLRPDVRAIVVRDSRDGQVMRADLA